MHPSLLPYHPERDVYRLLQVDHSASADEINAACRRLARTFHPDRNRSPRAHEEMSVVNAVRDMLTDAEQRAAYDRARLRYLSGWTPGAAEAARVVRTRPAAPAGEPASVERRWKALPAAVERTLLALMAAFRAALGLFGPSYCTTCGAMTAASDLYCSVCGSRLRRARRLSVDF